MGEEAQELLLNDMDLVKVSLQERMERKKTKMEKREKARELEKKVGRNNKNNDNNNNDDENNNGIVIKPTEEQILIGMEMGFKREELIKAYGKAKGNLQKAMDILTNRKFDSNDDENSDENSDDDDENSDDDDNVEMSNAEKESDDVGISDKDMKILEEEQKKEWEKLLDRQMEKELVEAVPESDDGFLEQITDEIEIFNKYQTILMNQ